MIALKENRHASNLLNELGIDYLNQLFYERITLRFIACDLNFNKLMVSERAASLFNEVFSETFIAHDHDGV